MGRNRFCFIKSQEMRVNVVTFFLWQNAVNIALQGNYIFLHITHKCFININQHFAELET